MKDCKKIHPLLSLYAEDALSPREKAAVEKHVSGCPVARAELEHWGRFRKSVKNLPEPKAPQDLHERIMARLQGREPLPSRSGLSFRYLWPLVAAACIALFLYIRNPNWLETSKPVASLPQPTQVVAMKPANRVSQFGNKGSASGNLGGTAESGNSLQEKQMAMAAAKKAAPVRKANLSLTLKNSGADTSSTQPGFLTGGLNGPKTENLVVASAQSAPPAPAAPSAPAPTPTAQGVTAAEMANQTIPYSTEISGQNWSGAYSPVTVESQLLIVDAATFQTQWDLVQKGQPLPAVDFTSQAVVLLTAGNEPTTGYSIHVSKLEEQAGQLVVHYQVVAPAPGAVTGQMFTRPWSMQAIPKPAKPVTFVKD